MLYRKLVKQKSDAETLNAGRQEVEIGDAQQTDQGLVVSLHNEAEAAQKLFKALNCLRDS